MTSPYGEFQTTPLEPEASGVTPSDDPIPVVSKAVLALSDEKRDALCSWLDEWIRELEAAQADKQSEWALYETAYRAKSDAPSDKPFVGSNKDTVPVVAMAVEPVHARLETGIFKQDPFVTVKPIRKAAKIYTKALGHWFGFYFTKVVPLQKIVAPALLEQCKLGTMVLKVPYVQENCRTRWYDNEGKIVTREFLKFRGPRPEAVSIGNFLFPAGYQHVQDCPLVVERQKTTLSALRKLEWNKQLDDVDKVVKSAGNVQRTDLEDAREQASLHESAGSVAHGQNEIVVYECWFQYDLNIDPEDGHQSDSPYPYQLVATYHPDTRTLLQLRYNPYYHQKYPYVVVPYTISSDSLYGVGIGEMAYAFQNAITQSQRNALDNSYLVNCRGFVRKRNSSLAEDPIRVQAGFTIWADDMNDVKPFALADIYQSTTSERQNLFGMVEKRTGVSDYMTGRESPQLGSRATATSTLALIQEGTRRVEQVMGNERLGFAEMFEMCMFCWAQFGLGDIDDYVFADEETGTLLDEFFKSVVRPENLSTLLTIDISPTDATTNRQVQQQMQVALIQLMTTYMQQLLQVGQLAMQANAQGMPQLTGMVETIVKSAQVMMKDLLDKYELPNADEYLPDILGFIRPGPPPGAGVTGIPGQLPPTPDMGAAGAPPPGPGTPSPFGPSRPPAPVGPAPVLPGAV